MLFNLPRHTPSVLLSPSPSLSRSGCAAAAASLLLLFSTDGLQNAVANGDTRTLSFHHTHSGEDLTVTFKREGRYDEDGLAQLNHFLRDWRNQDKTTMDRRLFDVVWEAYQDVGGRAPVQIISAYRSPTTNAMLHRRSKGVAEHSQHTLGKAMDFFIPGVSLENIRFAGLKLQRGGVGYYPSSGSPFVHLDVGGVRHWPRMTRDQLARVFPTGRTVHLPTDGRPLAGYALALADIERRGSSMPSRLSLASAQSAGALSGDERLTGGPKRSLLATLFGAREEKDDQSESTQAAPAPRGRTPDRLAAKPAVIAEAKIPLPRVRPMAPERAPANLVANAVPAPSAAAHSPPTPPAAIPSPSQVVQARGLWRSSDVVAAAQTSTEKPVQVAAVQAQQARRERLVWQVGPQPAGSGTTASKTQPARGGRVELASADITGSLPQWPGESAGERGTSNLVMAYAEPTTDRATASFRSSAAPMGSVRPSAATAARAGTAGRNAQTRPIANLVDKPWLRGVMLSPSVQTAMGVAVMGAPNYRELAQLMYKPTSVVAMSFSPDEATEPGAETFSGAAVAFVPTLSFGRVTARLN